MKINSDKVFNKNGNIKRQNMFAEFYGLMPSTYVVSYDEELKECILDLPSVNKEFIKNIYPDAKIYSTSGRHIDDEVSCVTEERNDEENNPPVYNRHGAYAISSYVSAETTIVLDDIHVIVTIDKNSMEAIYDYDSDIDIEKFCDDLFEKIPTISEHIDDDHPEVQLVAYSPDAGYYTMSSEINAVNIDIENNYNDDFKPIYDDIVNFLESEERKSGLIVLNGEPGTGKTYFIRHLITKCPNNYILIPPSIAPSLSSPEFMTFLVENRDSVFILEDCETVIKDRTISDFANAVSAVLNMSDGLMSDIFNGKFICTFNADINQIDEAILRKGRCFAEYEFGKLSKDKATSLLHKLGHDINADSDMTLADIYHYEDKNVESVTKKKKIGF
jgi:hypothetical protein